MKPRKFVSAELEQQVRDAHFGQKMSVRGCESTFKISEWMVRRILYPERLAEHSAKRCAEYKDSTMGKFNKADHYKIKEEPKNPLYSPVRDGVPLPASLTGLLMGDPLPGRSALDARKRLLLQPMVV